MMFCIAQRRLWQTFAQKAINITYYNININTNRFISFYHTLKKNEESPIKLLFLWRKKRKLMRVFLGAKVDKTLLIMRRIRGHQSYAVSAGLKAAEEDVDR